MFAKHVIFDNTERTIDNAVQQEKTIQFLRSPVTNRTASWPASYKEQKINDVTKTWNHLQPPKTTYNHLQPPTTTSENSTTTYNHLKKFNNHLQPAQINVFNNARRQHVTYLKYENRTKHPPPPKILLSLVPCIINHALKSRNEMRDHHANGTTPLA